jgi:hypothetical protein
MGVLDRNRLPIPHTMFFVAGIIGNALTFPSSLIAPQSYFDTAFWQLLLTILFWGLSLHLISMTIRLARDHAFLKRSSGISGELKEK